VTTPAAVGGSEWTYHTHRVEQAVREARTLLRSLLNERPGPQQQGWILAAVGDQLGIIQDANHELERIGCHAKQRRRNPPTAR
jgi:hypothetical protein